MVDILTKTTVKEAMIKQEEMEEEFEDGELVEEGEICDDDEDEVPEQKPGLLKPPSPAAPAVKIVPATSPPNNGHHAASSPRDKKPSREDLMSLKIPSSPPLKLQTAQQQQHQDDVFGFGDRDFRGMGSGEDRERWSEAPANGAEAGFDFRNQRRRRHSSARGSFADDGGSLFMGGGRGGGHFGGRGGFRGRGRGGGFGAPRWMERQICQFFREGYCRDGDNCSCSHQAEDSKRRPEVCKFYSSGHCKKGLACHHLHGEFPCKAFHKGECTRDPCQFSHQPLTDYTRPMFDQLMRDEHCHARDQRRSPIPHHLRYIPDGQASWNERVTVGTEPAPRTAPASSPFPLVLIYSIMMLLGAAAPNATVGFSPAFSVHFVVQTSGMLAGVFMGLVVVSRINFTSTIVLCTILGLCCSLSLLFPTSVPAITVLFVRAFSATIVQYCFVSHILAFWIDHRRNLIVMFVVFTLGAMFSTAAPGPALSTRLIWSVNETNWLAVSLTTVSLVLLLVTYLVSCRCGVPIDARVYRLREVEEFTPISIRVRLVLLQAIIGAAFLMLSSRVGQSETRFAFFVQLVCYSSLLLGGSIVVSMKHLSTLKWIGGGVTLLSLISLFDLPRSLLVIDQVTLFCVFLVSQLSLPLIVHTQLKPSSSFLTNFLLATPILSRLLCSLLSLTRPFLSKELLVFVLCIVSVGMIVEMTSNEGGGGPQWTVQYVRGGGEEDSLLESGRDEGGETTGDFSCTIINELAPFDAEIEEKSKILKNNPQLQELYKHLVTSKLLMPHNYKTTGKTEERMGMNGSFLAKISQADANGLKLNLNEIIFATYPMVERKHLELVPHEMSEEQFWVKFATSHYFHREREVLPNPDDPFADCVKADEEGAAPATNGTASNGLNGEGKSNGGGGGYAMLHRWIGDEEDPMESAELAEEECELQLQPIKIAEESSAAGSKFTDEEAARYRSIVADFLDDVSESDILNPSDDWFASPSTSSSSRNHANGFHSGDPDSMKKGPLDPATQWGALTPYGGEIRVVHDAVNELVKHFWTCFPPVSPELEAKIERMEQTLKKYEQSTLAEAEERFGFDAFLHTRDMIGRAHERYAAYHTKKNEKKK